MLTQTDAEPQLWPDAHPVYRMLREAVLSGDDRADYYAYVLDCMGHPISAIAFAALMSECHVRRRIARQFRVMTGSHSRRQWRRRQNRARGSGWGAISTGWALASLGWLCLSAYYLHAAITH